MRLACRPCRLSHWTRSKQKRASSRADAARSIGQLGDVGGVQAAGELVLDDGAGADTGLVDDQLARSDAGPSLVARFERGQRPLTGVDRAGDIWLPGG